jgi:hypothetical protein
MNDEKDRVSGGVEEESERVTEVHRKRKGGEVEKKKKNI